MDRVHRSRRAELMRTGQTGMEIHGSNAVCQS
jgi:hypothetical protein